MSDPTDDTDDQIQQLLADDPTTGAPDDPADAAESAPAANPAQWNQFLQSPPKAPAQPLKRVSTDVTYKGLPPGVNAGDDYARAEAGARPDAATVAERQQELGNLQRDYGGIAKATGQESDAEDLHFQITQGILKQQRAYVRAQAKMEEQAYADSKANAGQILAQYKEQIAGVRTLAAQSGNPLNNISKWQAMGLTGAMFAQGFLAARGINIDVAGQVDRWVQQGLQEHQEMVRNQRESAGETLHLYDIARQSSNDDFEARQRYRGFMLEGFKTNLEMEAARSGSDLAKARAGGIIAKAQLEQDQTMSALHDRWFTQDFNAKKEAINEVHLKHQDEAEYLRSKADLLRASAEANKNQKPVATYTVSDPENPAVNVARVKPGFGPELTTKIAEGAGTAREQYANYLDSTTRMMKSYAEAKKIRDDMGLTKDAGWDAVARKDSSGKVQRFIQDRQQWVLSKVYNDSGKQVNESEFDRQQGLAYLDKVFAENGEKGEQSFANLREYGRQKFERHLQDGGLEVVNPTDPDANNPGVKVSPKTAAEDSAILEGGAPVPTVADMGSPTNSDIKYSEGGTPTRAYRTLVPDGSKEPPDAHTVELLARMYLRPDLARAAVAQDSNVYDIPNGDDTSKHIELPKDDDTLRQQAIDGLMRLTADREPRTSGFAQIMLQQLQDDPHGVEKLLSIVPDAPSGPVGPVYRLDEKDRLTRPRPSGKKGTVTLDPITEGSE